MILNSATLKSYRKIILLLGIALLWEVYARFFVENELLLPPISIIIITFFKGLFSDDLPLRTLNSIMLLVKAYAIGFSLALLFAVSAKRSKWVKDLFELLTSMLNPLPAIALLPLGMLWFGIGNGGLILVIVHSVLWASAVNIYTGVNNVNPTIELVGKNYGLKGFRYDWYILLPATLPNIIASAKIGWSFGWRTLIAAELVFGASQNGGGLGWYIFANKNNLNIPEVFAGLLMITVIGLAMERIVFKFIEQSTTSRWRL